MPFRQSTISKLNAPPLLRGKSRQRYDEMEARRVKLISRLARLGENGRRHPGHRRVLTLLNGTFRKSRLEQRLAVLQAAAWLIDILEQVIVA